MKRKLKIAVLMGGKSPEHEVSVISGMEVVKSLSDQKYEVLPVIISKDGKIWKLTGKETLLKLNNPLNLKGSSKEIVLSKSKQISGVSSISKEGVDLVFIAMHGPFGEDGKVQGMLEIAGIPYTGSGVLASAIGMDKELFRKLMSFHKIPIPRYVVLKKGEKYKNIGRTLGKLPYFIKPVAGGSSVGASLAKNLKELKTSVNLAFEYDDRILVDGYIRGREFTCAVIGNSNPITLPVVEIRPLKGNFFDYESKYTESGSEETVPAKISKALTKKLQKTAIEIYKITGCRGFGRVDFILENGKIPIVLEINTIPGLTPMSLFPKAAKAMGISYSHLLDNIIKYAIEKD